MLVKSSLRGLTYVTKMSQTQGEGDVRLLITETSNEENSFEF